MPELMDLLQAVFRWLHVFAGIIWIGLLYFFNFVNAPFAGTLDADSRKKVVPELMPRSLFWFRWGAAWTWITGVLLLMLVFYHGGGEVLLGPSPTWGPGVFVMIAVTFLAVFLYDVLFKTALGKNLKIGAAVALILIAVVLYLMQSWAGFTYRAYIIHIGVLFGTIMAFNVWFRIWPSQKKIITAVKNGQAPDPALVALAGGRSRHNTYLSLPLIWAMLNQHTVYFSGGNLGLSSETAWISMLVVILLGWHIIWQLYRKAGKVKGF
jgi:uncharacterized membrane protein